MCKEKKKQEEREKKDYECVSLTYAYGKRTKEEEGKRRKKKCIERFYH